ncbi:glutamate 5-kinase [Aestuariibacter sp. AA17]|uniref:Glutamate 5-kinase n=1 Tax=Fluctibacter corallii TaxID=2984329 RepID=A0ABT3AB97_9ALTE|nr:glutamate 5-kinase [Aestuariibacter sp. AA17]MCV2885872.1 glutamate 5-kinase [Aestuariibacter sp. AA17]
MQDIQWQRAVIKVGSALISPDGQGCSGQYLLAIARFILASREAGKEVIVVSSGSVAAGRKDIPVTHTPSIAEKQAMAAIGQSQMVANWARFFDFPCAQLLLTYDDLHNRTRYVNIKNTLRELLKHGALPIVNENDTVAVNELKVGDNDNLAAYTAMVSQADLLIICSDIDGLFDADPRKNAHAKKIDIVDGIDDNIYALAGGAGTSVGTGGMKTKIQAAEKCTKSGITTLIVNGKKPEVFERLSEGVVSGTMFKPQFAKDRAKRQWLEHTLKSRGHVDIDNGAKRALLSQGASLLPSGVVQVTGEFSAGDALDILCNGEFIGKGLSLYKSDDLKKVAGCQSKDIARILGFTQGEEVIHRDDMIVIKQNKQGLSDDI